MKTEIAHEIPNDKPITGLPQFGSFLMTHRNNNQGLKTVSDYVIVMTLTSLSKYIGIYVCQHNESNGHIFDEQELKRDYVLLPQGYSLKLTQSNHGQ